MNELERAIHTNDLKAFVTALYKTLQLSETPNAYEPPATSDMAKAHAALSSPKMPDSTRKLITGIISFYDVQGYITEKQQTTIRAMFDQYGS